MKLAFYKNGDFAFSLELKPNSAIEFPAGISLAPEDKVQVLTTDMAVSMNTITRRLEDVRPGHDNNDFSNDFDQTDFN